MLEMLEFQQALLIEDFQAAEDFSIVAADQVPLPQPLFLLIHEDVTVGIIQFVEP